MEINVLTAGIITLMVGIIFEIINLYKPFEDGIYIFACTSAVSLLFIIAGLLVDNREVRDY